MSEQAISRHFRRQSAHEAATQATLSARKTGRSSGRTRIEYGVKRGRGLRRWLVVPR